MKRILALFPIFLAACATSTPSVPRYDIAPHVAGAKSVMERPEVAKAMAFVDSDRERIISEWRTITEIPAPSGQEAQRAEHVAGLLRALGLTVERDSAGNVMATRKGSGGGSHVVFDAHLDTVFPLGTKLTTRIENGRIYAPGVGDDTRNIAAILAMIRAMDSANVQTRGDVTFLFTVQEETNFGGVDQFLKDRAHTVNAFVALDGGYSNLTFGGIGIYWDRYHFIGPGGHTRSDAPPHSATLPLARAIDRLYRMRIPSNAWLNVGMLGAADVFNAKAPDAWMSVDLRSSDPETLHRLDREIEAIMREEAARYGMQLRRDTDSKSEVAALPGHRTSPMILTSEGVWRAFGFDPEINDTASNHAAPALLAGVPATSTGAGPCTETHSEQESCEIEPLFTGIKRNIVLAVALAELPPTAPAAPRAAAAAAAGAR